MPDTSSILHILFYLAEPLIGILLAGVYVYCIQDSLRRHRSWYWVLIVTFLPLISAPFYLLNFKLLGDDQGVVDKAVKSQTRLNQLKRDLEERDVPGVRREIAEIYFERGNYLEALKNLQPVLDADPEDIRAQFQAGVSLVRIGKAEQAIGHLDFVLEEDPKYRYGEARTALGDALWATEKKEDAAKEYRQTLERFNNPEAAVKYAHFLRDQGKNDEARHLLTATLQRVKDVPKEFLPGQKPWIKKAAELLREMK